VKKEQTLKVVGSNMAMSVQMDKQQNGNDFILESGN